MANPLFSSASASAAFATFASDAVTITRTGKGPPPVSVTTIYSGSADLQEGGGSTYYNPGGAVEVADAVLIVSADDATSLPAVEVGDVVTRIADSKSFTVASVSSRTWALPHLELKLNRGGVPMQQRLGRT